jgi:hypothetical protein
MELPAELTAIVVGSKRKYIHASMQCGPIFIFLDSCIFSPSLVDPNILSFSSTYAAKQNGKIYLPFCFAALSKKKVRPKILLIMRSHPDHFS